MLKVFRVLLVVLLFSLSSACTKVARHYEANPILQVDSELLVSCSDAGGTTTGAKNDRDCGDVKLPPILGQQLKTIFCA